MACTWWWWYIPGGSMSPTLRDFDVCFHNVSSSPWFIGGWNVFCAYAFCFGWPGGADTCSVCVPFAFRVVDACPRASHTLIHKVEYVFLETLLLKSNFYRHGHESYLNVWMSNSSTRRDISFLGDAGISTIWCTLCATFLRLHFSTSEYQMLHQKLNLVQWFRQNSHHLYGCGRS